MRHFRIIILVREHGIKRVFVEPSGPCGSIFEAVDVFHQTHTGSEDILAICRDHEELDVLRAIQAKHEISDQNCYRFGLDGSRVR